MGQNATTQNTTTPAGTREGAPTDVELTISGMTCASCAARIEKKLNKLDGVTASVNYATEKAKVSHTSDITAQDLIDVVEATGYTAALPAPPQPEQPAGADVTQDAGRRARDAEAAAWWQRLVISAALTVPVLLLSMVPALQFDNWQWLALTLASPVVVWGGWPFFERMGRSFRTRRRSSIRTSRGARSPARASRA